MHAEIERYLVDSGLAWTHLRPSQFMQIYFREVPTIASEGAFYLPLSALTGSPRRTNSRIAADPFCPVAPVTRIIGSPFRRLIASTR
jgi:uncharacterized protein YbjT (DUF2867 family)